MGWRGFGFVHQSRTLFCRAVPNPNITIRNFFIAVQHPGRAEVGVPHHRRGHGAVGARAGQVEAEGGRREVVGRLGRLQDRPGEPHGLLAHVLGRTTRPVPCLGYKESDCITHGCTRWPMYLDVRPDPSLAFATKRATASLTGALATGVSKGLLLKTGCSLREVDPGSNPGPGSEPRTRVSIPPWGSTFDRLGG